MPQQTESQPCSPSSPTKTQETPDCSIPQTFYPPSDNWLQSVSALQNEDTTKIVTGSSGLKRPNDYHKQLPQEPKRRTIYGVSIWVVALVVTLGAVAVAGAIGGGVAGSLASEECQRQLRDLRESLGPVVPTATSTGTVSAATSTAVAAAASTITVPETGCPESNGTVYTTSAGNTTADFVRLCDGVKIGNDMFQVSTPSWDACMDACVQFREFKGSVGDGGAMPQCVGISYVPEWSLHPEYARGNYSTTGSCWLKSGMGVLMGGGEWGPGTEVVSAVVRGE